MVRCICLMLLPTTVGGDILSGQVGSPPNMRGSRSSVPGGEETTPCEQPQKEDSGQWAETGCSVLQAWRGSALQAAGLQFGFVVKL